MSATVEANDVGTSYTASNEAAQILNNLATDLARAISEVALYLNLRDDAEIDEQQIIDELSDEDLDELETWVADVLATTAERGDLRANGGPLLVLPECLRGFFDLEQPDDAPEGSSEPQDASSDAPKAETPAEAKERIEAIIPTALRQLRDAESIAASRKAAHDAAKKNVDAMQNQLNQLVAELSEALEGINGKDFQFRLPFDRTSENSSALGGDANSGTATGSESGTSQSDEAIGWAVHVLTVDQLTEKTNGQSDGKGISEAIADKLVDNGLHTIGELESHMRQHSVYWFKPLKGIGEGKADSILDAVNALRRVYPQAGGE